MFDLPRGAQDNHDAVDVQMPIGGFSDFVVEPTCGLVSSTGLIGFLDDPSAFYEPDRLTAQLLWFRAGYVEYRFPNRVPPGARVQSLQLTAEICSEAPLHDLDWPSDITVWINGTPLGDWTCPSDFGGQRGRLTPSWWEEKDSQFGVLKRWLVTDHGTTIDGIGLSTVEVASLGLAHGDPIVVRIGVRPDAENVGGLNLFGRGIRELPPGPGTPPRVPVRPDRGLTVDGATAAVGRATIRGMGTSAFTEAELAYLASQRLGRLATVGRHGAPHVMPVGFRFDPETDTIVIGGHGMGTSKKWRDIGRDPRVAFVVDDVLPPWSPRLVEVRGIATRFDTGGSALGRGFDETFVRITPERVISYGLGDAGHDLRTFDARDVPGRPATRGSTVEQLVRRFELEPLPLEGGLFRQTWVGEPDTHGRPAGTAIIVLLAAEGGHFSAMHRLPIDETWYFQLGDPIELLLLGPGGEAAS